MHQLQRSWVRSQHPSAQWNLRAADEAVLNIVRTKKKIPPKNIKEDKRTLFLLYDSTEFNLGPDNFQRTTSKIRIRKSGLAKSFLGTHKSKLFAVYRAGNCQRSPVGQMKTLIEGKTDVLL
jgi:hypothetical protein